MHVRLLQQVLYVRAAWSHAIASDKRCEFGSSQCTIVNVHHTMSAHRVPGNTEHAARLLSSCWGAASSCGLYPPCGLIRLLLRWPVDVKLLPPLFGLLEGPGRLAAFAGPNRHQHTGSAVIIDSTSIKACHLKVYGI
jgi:hypothetical protein